MKTSTMVMLGLAAWLLYKHSQTGTWTLMGYNGLGYTPYAVPPAGASLWQATPPQY